MGNSPEEHQTRLQEHKVLVSMFVGRRFLREVLQKHGVLVRTSVRDRYCQKTLLQGVNLS